MAGFLNFFIKFYRNILREILKFWRPRNNAAALEMVQNNVNLNENFEQCFKAKMAFNSIGKEAVSDLRALVIILFQ